MDLGWGAAQHMVQRRDWKGGGEREGKSLGSGISKGQSRGRIQKPNGRLVLAPGSAFVRLRPPCAEGAGGSARPGASASAAVSPHPPRAGGGGGRGAREWARRAVWAEPARHGERPGGGRGGGVGAAARSPRLAPQLLRWHLQGCGGLGGPRRCGAGRLGMGGGGRLRQFPIALRWREGSPVDPDLSTPFGAFFHHPGWTLKKKKKLSGFVVEGNALYT